MKLATLTLFAIGTLHADVITIQTSGLEQGVIAPNVGCSDTQNPAVNVCGVSGFATAAFGYGLSPLAAFGLDTRVGADPGILRVGTFDAFGSQLQYLVVNGGSGSATLSLTFRLSRITGGFGTITFAAGDVNEGCGGVFGICPPDTSLFALVTATIPITFGSPFTFSQSLHAYSSVDAGENASATAQSRLESFSVSDINGVVTDATLEITPEPATWALCALGLGLVAYRRAR